MAAPPAKVGSVAAPRLFARGLRCWHPSGAGPSKGSRSGVSVLLCGHGRRTCALWVVRLGPLPASCSLFCYSIFPSSLSNYAHTVRAPHAPQLSTFCALAISASALEPPEPWTRSLDCMIMYAQKIPPSDNSTFSLGDEFGPLVAYSNSTHAHARSTIVNHRLSHNIGHFRSLLTVHVQTATRQFTQQQAEGGIRPSARLVHLILTRIDIPVFLFASCILPTSHINIPCIPISVSTHSNIHSIVLRF